MRRRRPADRGPYGATLMLGVALALAAAPASAPAQVRFHGEAAGASVQVRSWRDIPFRTVVRQQYDYSCGSAALATLLTYHYGRPTTEAAAFQAMFADGDQGKIQKVGFSLLDMKRFLNARGIEAEGYRMSIDDFARTQQPAIVLIDQGRYRHFAVVKGVAGGKVLVGDPALGLKIYPEAEFRKMWNGIAFAILPTPALPEAAFNDVSEWSPWSRAPLGAARVDTAIQTLTITQAPLYQITSIQVLQSATAGIRP